MKGKDRNNRNRSFECVYAGPDMLEGIGKKNADGENGSGEPEKKPYPDSFMQEDEPQQQETQQPRQPQMKLVYAGPSMRPRTDNMPIMQAVYACPPSVHKNAGQFFEKKPSMQRVYDGPRVRRGADAEMNEVYAGPGMMGELGFCGACGAKLNENAKFCSNCGARVGAAGESDSSGQAQPPKKPGMIRKGFIARPKGNRDELV